jgi:hypothetical protein
MGDVYMTAKISRLQELLYNTEASFLENAQSPASNTYAGRIPILGMAQMSLSQPRTSDQTSQSRKNASRPGFLDLRSGMLEFSTWVPGLMTDPAAGTATTNWFTDLLSNGLGGINSGDDGGTITSSTDGDTFVTTSVTLMTPGGIMRVGVKNDGRADGQPGVIGTWSAGSTQLLNALPGTPTSATPDAVRPTLVMYPTETNPDTTMRFLCGLTDTGAQWHAMGCQLDSVSFEFDIAGGKPPRATWKYQVAYWDRSAVTIPSAVALPNTDTAPIAGGSFFINTFGTTTRATEEVGNLTLSLRMGLIAQRGTAASQAPYTNITGWVSNGCIPELTIDIPWTTAAETSFDTDGSSTTYKHALFATNGTAARSCGFYLSRMFEIGDRPTSVDRGGLNYVRKVYQGTESTTTTSELTRSAFRFFCG